MSEDVRTQVAGAPQSNGIVVGLLGGIGSGKSAVARLLEEYGAHVVSGDEAGHAALCDPEIRAEIVRQWGNAILGEDGQVARRKLGAIVFANPDERRKLESLVHPWIKRRLAQEIDSIRANGKAPLIVLDAAVMLEAGWHEVCDRLVFVDAPLELRLTRVRDRGWDEAELARRESAQLPLAEKARRAGDVIDNSGSPDALRSQLERLFKAWGVTESPGDHQEAGEARDRPVGKDCD